MSFRPRVSVPLPVKQGGVDLPVKQGGVDRVSARLSAVLSIGKPLSSDDIPTDVKRTIDGKFKEANPDEMALLLAIQSEELAPPELRDAWRAVRDLPERSKWDDRRRKGTVKRLGGGSGGWCVTDDQTDAKYFFVNEIFQNPFRGLGSQEMWKVVSAADDSEHDFIYEVEQSSFNETFDYFVTNARVTFVPMQRHELKAAGADLDTLLLRIHSGSHGVKETSFKVPESCAGVACDIMREKPDPEEIVWR